MALCGRASGWSSRARVTTASRADGARWLRLPLALIAARSVFSFDLLTDYMACYILPVVRLHDTSNRYFIASVFDRFVDSRRSFRALGGVGSGHHHGCQDRSRLGQEH